MNDHVSEPGIRLAVIEMISGTGMFKRSIGMIFFPRQLLRGGMNGFTGDVTKGRCGAPDDDDWERAKLSNGIAFPGATSTLKVC
jgi:hypothetical protein